MSVRINHGIESQIRDDKERHTVKNLFFFAVKFLPDKTM